MIIALDKNNKRIHIDDTNKNEKYYCQTCGEELCLKKGNIKMHHFSHKFNTNCDNWHYDMSEWHSSWQNQFPIENQEVVFEFGGKKHRADVFINNTIIEFQHSTLAYEEFEDRNLFYNSLGYKVIWIFDAKEVYESEEIERHLTYKNQYFWTKQFRVFRGLKEITEKVDIYLQENDNIWKKIPEYKNSIVNIYDTTTYAHLHHIDWSNGNGLECFISYNENILFDFELVNKYIPIRFMNIQNFNYKNLQLLKSDFEINDISDELHLKNNVVFDTDFKYIWCPALEKYVYSGSACHACINLSKNYDRCKYRFEKLLSKKFDKILNVEYSNEGKVKHVTILKDNKIYRIKYDDIPTEIFTLKEVFQIFPQADLIGVKNIKSGWNVLLTKYNYERLIKYGECYGRTRSHEKNDRKYSKFESQIFNWNKKEWNVTWVKSNK